VWVTLRRLCGEHDLTADVIVLFEQHAQNAVEAAQALAKLFGDFTDVENKVRDIHAIEHHGDKLNHEIVRHLNETFVTPLDREDIVAAPKFLVCRDNALELYKCDLLNAFSRFHFSLDADMETYFALVLTPRPRLAEVE